MSSLGFDIGDQDIPNGVGITIDFELSKKEFVIMSSDKKIAEEKGYRALIKDMRLLIPCRAISDTLFDGINARIKEHPYIIPHYRTEVITHTVGINKTTYETDRLFIGSSITPAKIIVGFVSTESFLGKYDKNPFNFLYSFGGNTATDPTTCKVKMQRLTLNGNTLDGLDTDDDRLAYVKMQNNLNMLDSGHTNSITQNKFIAGSYLTPYDLTTNPGWSTSDYLTPKVRDGQYRY